ncbi:MAG: hypothetical protein RBG13Loki_1648 [Promethearchaeota archaeon CR_4]|nr:MAG: hypothetical protein RBG13Loki_1648 [Candidatus Lokiarchaeota archaeon CR_4]
MYDSVSLLRPDLVSEHPLEDREYLLCDPPMAVPDRLLLLFQADLLDLPHYLTPRRPAPRPRVGIFPREEASNDVIPRTHLEMIFFILSLVPERFPNRTLPFCISQQWDEH